MYLFAGVSILLVAIGFIIVFTRITTLGSNEITLIATFIVIWVLTGSWFLYLGIRVINPNQAPLVRMLRDNPKKVNWIYAGSSSSYGDGFNSSQTFIDIYTVDNHRYRIPVKRLNLTATVDALNAICPQASLSSTNKTAQHRDSAARGKNLHQK